jgi:hypothetical protein
VTLLHRLLFVWNRAVFFLCVCCACTCGLHRIPTSTSHPPTPSPIPTQHDDSEWHIYLPSLSTHNTSSYVSRAPRCALALLLIVELRASQPAVPPRRPRPPGREGWGARGGRGATGTADTLDLLYFLAMCYPNHYAWKQDHLHHIPYILHIVSSL